MRIKICGITRVEDARAAVALGADAIGMVFHPGSQREITSDRARLISDAVGDAVERVGVLVDAGLEEMRRLVLDAHLSAIQLHLRSCRPELAVELGVPVIPFLPASSTALVDSGRWWPRLAIMVDSLRPDGSGGTGSAPDLGVAEALARHRPVWIAGGLGPETVGEAVRRVRPFGVDASSRLESRPGIKDLDLMSRFISMARKAEVGN